jgi:hypothetical protein
VKLRIAEEKQLRIADFGLRIGASELRETRQSSRIEPARDNPQSAIRNPKLFAR